MTPTAAADVASGSASATPASPIDVAECNAYGLSLTERARRALMNNYGEREITMVRGEGARLWDSTGKEYLDFLGGIAVCSLGHCPPTVIRAIRTQSEKLLHTSNFFLFEPQIRLAELIAAATGMDKVTFQNSGTEATEAAMKLARYYANKKYGVGKRPNILTLTGSFHGRTMGAVSATHSPKCRDGFEPFAPGFVFVEHNNVADLRAKAADGACAILFETVQGEGGIRPVNAEFARAARDLATQYDLCLIVDEVQCGFSRTGHYFAYQAYDGLVPDVVPMAKALGAGFPIGALAARGKWAEVFEPGKHGTTFGGNPLACAAALAACTELLTPRMLAHVVRVGSYLREGLARMAVKYKVVKEVRGMGLMWGIELSKPGMDLYKACLRRGLIINCTANTVLRIVPPLVITEADCDRALAIIDAAFEEVFPGE